MQTYSEIDEKYRLNIHLAKYLTSELSPLTRGNTVTLLVNGEEKYPVLAKALEEAREHIHIEYYIYENDRIGQAIADILIRKAKSGVAVRFIYDDFGNRGVFWRDTHLVIEGPGVQFLQYLFVCDWNFCSGKPLEHVNRYFPVFSDRLPGNQVVQIAASGPDSECPTILYSLLYVISQAQEEILLTTPYFIPEQSILDALMMAALGGVIVKLLVPEKGDSKLVDLAASSYYEDLLGTGVKLFFYKKGFVHAKTIVVDKKLAMIGTANMDYRSFDLNFEVNAVVYDQGLATQLADVFQSDLNDAVEVDKSVWPRRSRYKKFLENSARLVSPLL